MGGLEIFLLPLLLIGLLWFMGAPQRRMRKEQAALMESLAPGMDVMTHGGLYGTVVDIDDDVVVLETAPGVTMRWAKRAITSVVTPDPTAEDADLLADGYADDGYADEDDAEDFADEDFADDEEDAGDEEDGDGDESGEASEDAAEDWEDVEVPDDASSLTSPDDDDDKPKA
jgi:preprotein translocase subunit YajC